VTGPLSSVRPHESGGILGGAPSSLAEVAVQLPAGPALHDSARELDGVQVHHLCELAMLALPTVPGQQSDGARGAARDGRPLLRDLAGSGELALRDSLRDADPDEQAPKAAEVLELAELPAASVTP
jgi:hypothetical protein